MAGEWVLAWLTGVARQRWTHSLFLEWVLLLLCWTSLITMATRLAVVLCRHHLC